MKKRLAALALVGGMCALGSMPALANDSHGGAAKPGLVYGGFTKQGAQVWIRLRPGRRSIASLHLDWRASAGRCTNGRPLVMSEDLGADNGFPAIKLHSGRFSQTVPEQAGGADGTGPERFTIAGSVTDAKVTGTFSASVTIDVTGGGQYTCTLPRTSFSAVN